MSAHSQARATASRAGDLQVGAGFAFAKPDFYPTGIFKGFTGYASFDFKPHFGVEVDYHQVNAPNDSKAPNKKDVYERSYEVGGRYVRHYGIAHPYAKLMYGRGVFNYEYNLANLAYNMGVIGAGVDFNVTRRINVRGDYEYQRWFGFHGNLFTNSSTSLSPQVITIGAAYHFR